MILQSWLISYAAPALVRDLRRRVLEAKEEGFHRIQSPLRVWRVPGNQ